MHVHKRCVLRVCLYLKFERANVYIDVLGLWIEIDVNTNSLPYLHCYNRYKAHTHSLKLKTMLKKSIQERIHYMEERQLALERFQLGNKWIKPKKKRENES